MKNFVSAIISLIVIYIVVFILTLILLLSFGGNVDDNSVRICSIITLLILVIAFIGYIVAERLKLSTKSQNTANSNLEEESVAEIEEESITEAEEEQTEATGEEEKLNNANDSNENYFNQNAETNQAVVIPTTEELSLAVEEIQIEKAEPKKEEASSKRAIDMIDEYYSQGKTEEKMDDVAWEAMLYGDDDINESLYDESNECTMAIALSAAISEKVVTKNDIYKYRSTWGNWDFKKALLDAFPSLLEDFDEESSHNLNQILEDLYVFDPGKAIVCLKWLLHTFTPEEMRKVNDEDSNKDDDIEEKIFDVQVRTLGLLYGHLAIYYRNGNVEDAINKAKYLYDYVISDKLVDEQYFGKTVWEKHDCFWLDQQMRFFVSLGDYEKAMDGYKQFLVGQKGRYNDNDLYHFWEHYIISLHQHIKERIPIEFFNFVIDEVEKLGKYASKLKEIVKENMNYYVFGENNDYDEDDDDYDEDDDDGDNVESVRESVETEEQKDGTIDLSFIRRDLEQEKAIGIKDIRLHAYWAPTNEKRMILFGEIIVDQSIKSGFYIQGLVFDKDGDLLQTKTNGDYGDGNSWYARRCVMPELIFTRYPLVLSFNFESNEVPNGTTIKLVARVAKERATDVAVVPNVGVATLNVDNELAKISSCVCAQVQRMETGEKIPGAAVGYYVEDYIGADEIKCNFFKGSNSNTLVFTTIVKGNVAKDGQIYYLFYNEKEQLIEYSIKHLRVDESTEKAFSDFTFIPKSERIGKILVYVGAHANALPSLL